jgi:hypothetical protein
MHPPIEAEIAKARIADLQRQADRIAIARAARRASRGVTAQGRYPAVGLARRVLTVMAARRLSALARSLQLPDHQPPAPCSTCV